MQDESTTLRIHGAPLGEDDTYIDCAVTTITLDETVTLSDTNSDRTWTVTLSDIRGAETRDLLIRHEECPYLDHGVWQRLEGLRADLQTAPFDDENLDDDAKALFKRVVRKMRQTDS